MHGSIAMSSIVVTRGGDWKLGLFDTVMEVGGWTSGAMSTSPLAVLDTDANRAVCVRATRCFLLVSLGVPHNQTVC